MNVHWTDTAATHLDAIYTHIALDSPEYAKRMVDRLTQRSKQIGLFPFSLQKWYCYMKFSELIRLLEENGFGILKKKGSIRYYSKPGRDKLIRIDFHGSKDIPTGTCNAVLNAAGLSK